MRKLERENVKVVKEFYRAMAGDDWSAARSVLDPNVQWIEPNIAGVWFSGTHYGSTAVFKEIVETVRDKFDDFQMKMKKFFAVGDYVIVLGRIHGRSKTTELKLDTPAAYVWRISEGKAVRVEAFHDILEWQVVLGLTSMQTKLAA